MHAEGTPRSVKRSKTGHYNYKTLSEAPGNEGWLGNNTGHGVAIYTTDGKHAISGYMYDENGSNLSEQLFQKELYGGTGDVEEDGQRPLAGMVARTPYRAVCLCRSFCPTAAVLAAIPPLGRGQ